MPVVQLSRLLESSKDEDLNGLKLLAALSEWGYPFERRGDLGVGEGHAPQEEHHGDEQSFTRGEFLSLGLTGRELRFDSRGGLLSGRDRLDAREHGHLALRL